MNAVPQPRILLIVEDNPADAELVRDMLESDRDRGEYDVLCAARLADAAQLLRERQVDLVLLDLRLPDAAGIEGVRELLEISPDLPIVVLTAMDDEDLALACIDAGAQDYLKKEELRPLPLRRAIGYAITRLREKQLRDMHVLLNSYRSLSSAGTQTSVTAAMAGLGPIRERTPEMFDGMVRHYRDLLSEYLELLSYKKERPREFMASLVTQLGDLGAGPRDLLDLHVAALDSAVQIEPADRGRIVVVEGRLMALEMMGLLVDYYRTGIRRRRTLVGETR